MSNKENRVNLRLDNPHFNIYQHYELKHDINKTKLTEVMLKIAELNETQIVSIINENKKETDLLENYVISLPERTDRENVINITQRNDIVIASTPKVKKGLIKKGYLDTEITEISRYKHGDIFASDFNEYGLSLPKYSTITINGIVREGETSLLRNREFSEPLRLVIKNLWNTRGIETILITNMKIYRLHSIMDYTEMEYQAIKTTFKGRMAQASNRTNGLTEVLRNYLITVALPPTKAVELTVNVLKSNGVWVKATDELNDYIDHFVDNILIKEYKLKMIAGYNMIELKEILLSAFKNINLELDEKLICKKNDCYNIRSKKTNLCPTCRKLAEEQYLN